MARTYHVHGPCYVQTNTGTNAAYETLGMTVEGARITITPIKQEVRSDAAAGAPADLQFMGDTAQIDVELADWDDDVLDKVIYKSMASATDGASGKPGALMSAGNFAHSLYLPSTANTATPSQSEDPWVFGCVTLRNPHEVNVGTRVGVKRLSFFAWRPVGPTATTVNNTALYTRVAPA